MSDICRLERSIIGSPRIDSGAGKSITPKALQRLQGLPDSWILPEDPRLSVRMIGNSVIPIVAQAVIESIEYL